MDKTVYYIYKLLKVRDICLFITPQLCCTLSIIFVVFMFTHRFAISFFSAFILTYVFISDNINHGQD